MRERSSLNAFPLAPFPEGEAKRLEKRPTRCYCETVKNITVSVDERTYHRARVFAAQKNTSVSALVKYFLSTLVEEESEFDRLKRREHELRASLRGRGAAFSAADRLSRDQVHDRDALRRHEHPSL